MRSPFRAARVTPKPLIQGPQTAIVVGVPHPINGEIPKAYIQRRENTEGSYVMGSEGMNVTDDLAMDFCVATTQGTERIIRLGFPSLWARLLIVLISKKKMHVLHVMVAK